MDNNNKFPSLLGSQNLGLGTFQSQPGSITSQVVSFSRHPDPKSVPLATAGRIKAPNGHEGAQGSGGREPWVNRIFIRLGLRCQNQFEDAISDTESQKQSSRSRLSSWLKRGLLRKEKKNKGKAPQTNELQTLMHNNVVSFGEGIDLKEKEKQAPKNRLSVVPEHPCLFRNRSKRTKASIFQQIGPDSECGPRVRPVGTDGSKPRTKCDEQQAPGARAVLLSGQSISEVEPELSTLRLDTVGWLASLPSASDISQLRRDSLGAEVVKETLGTGQFRQALHQEPHFSFGGSGDFVRGTSSIQHLASSRHPIADAHAEEWRRRTVGGFPIPERRSSRWRPRSRCASSRRCGSIDSRQTTYNPYDLPRIPRQHLFTDLVDLLSLSKAVNRSLDIGNSLNSKFPLPKKKSMIGNILH